MEMETILASTITEGTITFDIRFHALIPDTRHLPTSTVSLRKSIWRFCLTDRTIRLLTATTMPVPPLPEGNPPCIRSAATRRPRFCR